VTLPHVLSAASLSALYVDIWREAERAMRGSASHWQVAVEGRITEVDQEQGKRYPTLYGVPIEDPSGVTKADIPRALVEASGIREGDWIRAYGQPSVAFYRGAVQCRLIVQQLEQVDSPEEVQRQHRDRLTFKKVRALRKAVPFPRKEPLLVSVVASSRGVVQQDFAQALGEALQLVEIVWHHAAMTDPKSVAAEVEAAKGDVVVIARGGGDRGEFEGLNSEALAKAISSKDAFRILAVGHTADSTLLDFLVDHCANTPADAGTFIRDLLLNEVRQKAQHEAELEARTRESRNYWEGQLVTLRGERERMEARHARESAKLTEEGRKAIAEAKRQGLRARLWMAAAVTFLVASLWLWATKG
jgi:exodeoxyribonuclease VII large subunit